MVKIQRAGRELRTRDQRRKRYILRVGGLYFHITATEAKSLLRDLQRLLKR